jgi:hypothetical protein
MVATDDLWFFAMEGKEFRMSSFDSYHDSSNIRLTQTLVSDPHNGDIYVFSYKYGTHSGHIKDLTAKLSNLKYERLLACTDRYIRILRYLQRVCRMRTSQNFSMMFFSCFAMIRLSPLFQV